MEPPRTDVRARIPFPAWRNVSWEPPRDMRRPLSSFQETFILSAYPPGTRILSARFHRSVRLPCPIWVRVVLPQGEEEMLILRMDYTLYGVDREAAILSILAKHGLSVPTVLAGPVIDPTQPDAGAMTLLNVLLGQDLLSWSWNASAEEVEHALRLVLEGVERLHLLTELLKQEPLAQQLPHRTLHMELQELIADGGPWLDEPVFAQAVEHLLPIVASLHIPLAFSSGDYNPGNFLFEGETASFVR